MKIIHIVENLDKGAVENWLVNVFTESRKLKPEWEWTFYCFLGREGRLDEQVKAAGGTIIYATCTISHKILFLKVLRKVLKDGCYDIIHSHHDYLSGFYLIASHGIKFKKRILHVHNTDAALPIGNKLLHKLLLTPLRHLALYYNNLVVGISSDTLQHFIQNAAPEKCNSTVLYYGINMDRFNQSINSAVFKKILGIPQESILLLFSGRMNKEKNPVFVVEILNEMLMNGTICYALFVGEGEVIHEVKSTAQELNIESYIRCLGWRSDLPEIMLCSDVFVFPRVEYPKEGLGLVVVEAQAAGLPMILSNGIVPDAIEIPELAYFISLQNSPAYWASVITNIKKRISQSDACKQMQQSKFALPIATRNLLRLYES